MPECHVLLLIDLMILKPFSLKFCYFVSISLGICAIFLHKKCLVLRKSACPFGQVKTKIYLPESPFFKNSLAGASGLVLMSNPVEEKCQSEVKTSPLQILSIIMLCLEVVIANVIVNYRARGHFFRNLLL